MCPSRGLEGVCEAFQDPTLCRVSGEPLGALTGAFKGVRRKRLEVRIFHDPQTQKAHLEGGLWSE